LWGDVTKNICEYMNSKSNKEFKPFTVSLIRKALREELYERKKCDIKIRSRTKAGKLRIYKRTAKIINDKYKLNLTAGDIRNFKMSEKEEFTYRTKKCTWNIPEVRNKLGFDPETGLEIKEED
jgi:hypothetical protein